MMTASYDAGDILPIDIAGFWWTSATRARLIAGLYLGQHDGTASAECGFVAQDGLFRLGLATVDEFEEPSLKMSLARVESEG